MKSLYAGLVLAAVACADRDERPPVRWLPISISSDASPLRARPAGKAVPFRDRNRNGRYDPFVDPIGFCGESGACSIPDRRITIHRLRRNGLAGSSAGVFVWAQETGEAGTKTLDVPVCDRTGDCSRPMKLPFGGIAHEVHARWTCTDEPEQLDVSELTVGGTSVGVSRHPHVRVVVERSERAAFTIRSSEAIDRLRVRLVRLEDGNVDEVIWSSGTASDAVRFTSASEAVIEIAPDAVAACPDCAVMIQVMHVWQDDVLRDVSESWTTVSLTGGSA